MGKVTLEKHVEARIPGFTFPVYFGGCFNVSFLHEVVAKKCVWHSFGWSCPWSTSHSYVKRALTLMRIYADNFICNSLFILGNMYLQSWLFSAFVLLSTHDVRIDSYCYVFYWKNHLWKPHLNFEAKALRNWSIMLKFLYNSYIPLHVVTVSQNHLTHGKENGFFRFDCTSPNLFKPLFGWRTKGVSKKCDQGIG